VDPAIWAALIASAAGAISGGIGLYASHAREERIKQLEDERDERQRQLQAETILARYRDPLITAIFELQDRIQNLLRLEKSSVLAYLAVPGRGELAVQSTLFRFAQYFGWTEIVRLEIQFRQFDATSATRGVQDAAGKVQWAFATDKLGSDFMLWREEQRAIGERMLTNETELRTCIGFASFMDRYAHEFAPWLDSVATTLQGTLDKRRLVALHHLLIDLAKQLDPNEIRYPWGHWDFRDPRYSGPELDLRGTEAVERLLSQTS